MAKVTIPTNLPANAQGFIAVRADRKDYFAVYDVAGRVQSTFRAADMADAIRQISAAAPQFSVTEAGYIVAR